MEMMVDRGRLRDAKAARKVVIVDAATKQFEHVERTSAADALHRSVDPDESRPWIAARIGHQRGPGAQADAACRHHLGTPASRPASTSSPTLVSASPSPPIARAKQSESPVP